MDHPQALPHTVKDFARADNFSVFSTPSHVDSACLLSVLNTFSPPKPFMGATDALEFFPRAL